jgi:hypothetical protein
MYSRLNRKRNWKNSIGILLYIILIISIIYIVAKIITSPAEAVNAVTHSKVKSDYVLMLLQCLLGIFVTLLPSIIERRFSVDIPDTMEILYFIFLFCAIYLGEVQNFYYLIPNWDTILHAFSAAMLGAMGFSLVSMLNNADQVRVNLSPLFIALFAFCFALSAGAIWEIYEYSFDGLFNLNMQKFAVQDGTLLTGHLALTDTMYDIIVDAVSALVTSIIGYCSIKKQANRKQRYINL